MPSLKTVPVTSQVTRRKKRSLNSLQRYIDAKMTNNVRFFTIQHFNVFFVITGLSRVCKVWFKYFSKKMTEDTSIYFIKYFVSSFVVSFAMLVL